MIVKYAYIAKIKEIESMMLDVKRQNDLLRRREKEREDKIKKIQQKKKKRREESSSSDDSIINLPKKKPIQVNPQKFVEVFDPFQFVPSYNKSMYHVTKPTDIYESMMPYKQLIEKKNQEKALLEQKEREAQYWQAQVASQPKVNFAETVRSRDKDDKKKKDGKASSKGKK